MQQILGQDEPLALLQRALASGRFHHAWIFSGPRGVGKFTTAVALATILLDPEAGPNLAGEIEANPEGRAASLIAAGTHPDLHIVRKELALYSDDAQLRSRKLANIPLDILRQHMIGGKTANDKRHQAPAYRTAALGHGKVFIVDEAELIDVNGQNALLKTLEEPPPATYVILITARPGRLLPTIRSRCQHVRFGRLDAAAMERWFDQSSIEIPAEDRAWIEQFAEGAPGLALLAAEHGFADWQRRLAPMMDELARGRFPAALGETLAELVDRFASAWVKQHKNASKDAANKDGAGHVFTLLASDLRARLRHACGDARTATPLLEAIELLREAERQLQFNVNAKHVLENLVVQCARSFHAASCAAV